MKKSSQVSQLGASATTSGKALDLGRGEPWEKAAHKLGLLPFPASPLKSTEAKPYSPEGGKTKSKITVVKKKTSGGKKAGADRSMDETSKPKQRKPRAKKTPPVTTKQPKEEEVLAKIPTIPPKRALMEAYNKKLIRERPSSSSNESVLVIDSVEKATLVVQQLMGEYKNRVHACDTEVGEIDVKNGHGRISYFSIYCVPSGNFGDGKSYLWVDVLDGGGDVLKVFQPYFEDPCVKKVWHNYNFDKHILSRHGIYAQGFFRADTMFLASAELDDLARSAKGLKGCVVLA